MSTLADRIAQFRNMTANVPDDELGHYRLGQLLVEAGDFAEAVKSFERTVAITPTFSKAYQLQAESLLKLGDTEAAVEVLTRGWSVANDRGDNMPRDAMAEHLRKLGAPVPTAAPAEDAVEEDRGPETNFRCQRPGCPAGKYAQPLTSPPMPDAIGQRVAETICATCWESWKKDYSVKVINELRIDLSTESGTAEYDRHMRSYFGFDDEVAPSVGPPA